MGIKDDILKDIEIRLGGGMVDVELDSSHYELALSQAFRKYRARRSSTLVGEKGSSFLTAFPIRSVSRTYCFA